MVRDKYKSFQVAEAFIKYGKLLQIQKLFKWRAKTFLLVLLKSVKGSVQNPAANLPNGVIRHLF